MNINGGSSMDEVKMEVGATYVLIEATQSHIKELDGLARAFAFAFADDTDERWDN